MILSFFDANGGMFKVLDSNNPNDYTPIEWVREVLKRNLGEEKFEEVKFQDHPLQVDGYLSCQNNIMSWKNETMNCWCALVGMNSRIALTCDTPTKLRKEIIKTFAQLTPEEGI